MLYVYNILYLNSASLKIIVICTTFCLKKFIAQNKSFITVYLACYSSMFGDKMSIPLFQHQVKKSTRLAESYISLCYTDEIHQSILKGNKVVVYHFIKKKGNIRVVLCKVCFCMMSFHLRWKRICSELRNPCQRGSKLLFIHVGHNRGTGQEVLCYFNWTANFCEFIGYPMAWSNKTW